MRTTKGTYTPFRTKFVGVYYVLKTGPDGKPERNVYIGYYREGRRHFEPVGAEGSIYKGERLTPAVASRVRGNRIKGLELPNRERRAQEKAAAEAVSARWTINRLWEAWQADPENQGKRGTMKADQKFQKHLAEPFGEKTVEEITQIDIDRLRLDLAKKHSRETTISILGLLKRITRYGFGKGYSPALSFPIVLKGKKLGRDPRPKRALTDAEIAAFIKTCREWPDRQIGNFMLLMAYTGMRRGSARNLKWEDIDLDAGRAILRDSKTGDVPILLSGDAVELLRNHPRETKSPYVFTGRGWVPVLDAEGKPVLHKKNGRMRRQQEETTFPQLTQRQIDREPGRIRDAAGLSKDLDPCHSFRRGLATRLDAHGASIKTIMLAGGWKSPQMALHYTRPQEQTVRAAVDALAESIKRAAVPEAKDAEGERA